MTKLVENSFRAVNIAWINEMANLAAKKDLNISEVVELANTKPYGFMKFTPGSGAGGHCIPADPHYLLMESGANTTPITTLAMQELHRRPVSIANQAARLLRFKEISQPRVLIWGISYKPNVSDVRESPALAIIGELLNQGIKVDYHDPLVDEVGINSISVVGISSPKFVTYDLIILHTIHDSGVPEEIFQLDIEILDTTFKFTNRAGVVNPE
jgi:nucleotide sugar dehydrogenase